MEILILDQVGEVRIFSLSLIGAGVTGFPVVLLSQTPFASAACLTCRILRLYADCRCSRGQIALFGSTRHSGERIICAYLYGSHGRSYTGLQRWLAIGL